MLVTSIFFFSHNVLKRLFSSRASKVVIVWERVKGPLQNLDRVYPGTDYSVLGFLFFRQKATARRRLFVEANVIATGGCGKNENIITLYYTVKISLVQIQSVCRRQIKCYS